MKEYQGILADAEAQSVFRTEPEKVSPLTVEAATELKWISEAIVCEELTHYEKRTELRVDCITLKRNDAGVIEKVEIKVCL